MTEIDIFDTAEMLEAIEVSQEPTTFLQTMFFPDERIHGSVTIDFDLRKKKRRIAAYVSRRAEGQNVEKTKFKQFTYEAPYVKPKKTITVSDLLRRNLGEIRWVNGLSQLAAAGQKLQEEFDDLDEMITRTEEQQASEILLTGKLNPLDENGKIVGDEIDFTRDAGNTVTLSGGQLWDSSTGKILENLRTWKRIVSLGSGVLPPIAVAGSAAVDAMLADDEVREVLDNRRFIDNEIAMRAEGMNATFVGRIEELMIFAYDGIFIDSSTGSDVVKNFVPADQFILGGPETNMRNYGVIEWMEDDSEVLFAAKRLPVSWTEKDPAKRYLQVHSAPLLVTKNPDTILAAKVTA